jgi:hypothetical protein
MAIKYTYWQCNLPNGNIIYQHLPLQDPRKFTKIWIFGLKIYHLATPECAATRKGFRQAEGCLISSHFKTRLRNSSI